MSWLLDPDPPQKASASEHIEWMVHATVRTEIALGQLSEAAALRLIGPTGSAPARTLRPEPEPLPSQECGYCGADEARIARSAHIVDEVLVESRGTVIDAELFLHVDEEFGLEVLDGDLGAAEAMLAGFIEYGWAETDEDGDVVRTRRCKCDWTSEEQRNAEELGELPRAWKLGWKRDHGHVESCHKGPKQR